MGSALTRLEPPAYAALRVVAGLLFLFHGLQKFGLIGGQLADFGTLRGVAGIVEVITGPLIMIGLLTPPAAFIASGQMAVAYFMSHAPRAAWPIQNGGEPAVLFCFIFLYIAARGGGRFSVDALRGGKRR
jgi:putative oxidoreductase